MDMNFCDQSLQGKCHLPPSIFGIIKVKKVHGRLCNKCMLSVFSSKWNILPHFLHELWTLIQFPGLLNGGWKKLLRLMNGLLPKQGGPATNAETWNIYVKDTPFRDEEHFPGQILIEPTLTGGWDNPMSLWCQKLDSWVVLPTCQSPLHSAFQVLRRPL